MMTQILMILSFLSVLHCITENQSYADFYLHLFENHSLLEDRYIDLNNLGADYQLTLQSFLYQSKNLFLPSGDSSPSPATHVRFGEDLNFSFAIGNLVTLFSRATGSYLINSSPECSSRGFSLTDQTIALSSHLYSVGRFSLNGQVQVDFPLYDFASNEELGIGDQSSDWSYGLFGNYSFLDSSAHSLIARIGLGMTFRSRGYSNALPYSGELLYRPEHSGIFTTVGIFGVHSLKTDQSTVWQEAPSSFFGQVNPELLQIKGTVGYLINDKTSFSLAVFYSLSGENAPQGATYLLNWTFRGGMSSRGFDSSEDRALVLEAKLLKVNQRFLVVQINKGFRSKVECNQVFELVRRGFDQADEILALASVVSVKEDDAALEVTEFFKDKPLDTSLIAKRRN